MTTILSLAEARPTESRLSDHSASQTAQPKTLPLASMHEDAGAKFMAFAGWSMPVSYPLGTLGEHAQVRERAGLFDVTHMRLFAIEGPDAAKAIEQAAPVPASDQPIGRNRYSFFLNDDAGIIDDMIVSRLGETRFIVVANAARFTDDHKHLASICEPLDVTLTVLERVFLALQGPDAPEVLESIGVGIDDLPFMSCVETDDGLFVSASGYTGEMGYEIAVPVDDAEGFAASLLEDERVQWCGLAARDSLRLEAGLCLYGQDLDETIDPVTAALLWAIPKPLRAGGPYRGAEALAAIIEKGATDRVRVGLTAKGRRPIRAHTGLLDGDGRSVGEITSGTYGPSVGHAVAMGYVARSNAAPGTRLSADLRGGPTEMVVTKMPFIEARPKKR